MTVDYHKIMQMGLQSLAAIGIGYGCGAARVVDAGAAVSAINALMLRVCLPCLQVWLLAVRTDMRAPGNWGALGVAMLWAVLLQAGLVAHQLMGGGGGGGDCGGGKHYNKQQQQQQVRRLDPARLGVDALLLTTNNTGVLGPVVLAAALGDAYAPLGMLATVVMYFEQLPLAQLLFHFHHHQQHQQQQHQQRGRHHRAATSAPTTGAAGWQEGGCKAAAAIGRPPPLSQQQDHASLSPHPRHHQSQLEQQQQQREAAVLLVGADGGGKGAAVPLDHHCSSDGSSDGGGDDASDDASGTRGRQDAGATVALLGGLLHKSLLVWSTGAAVLLSCLGSAPLLDPRSPAALRPLAFVDGLLGWFAQTTAPLTLFATGLWIHSWASGQQQQQQQQQQQSPALQDASGASAATALSWPRVATMLALRATLAPGLMVVLCRLAGMRGDRGLAMVLLALLPPAQMAFVLSEQGGVGTAEVSAVTVAGLLLMLPQQYLSLALLEASGVLAAPEAAAM